MNQGVGRVGSDAAAPRVLKLYESVRTAHLERLAGQPRTTLLFQVQRYDFDHSLAEGLDLRRAGLTGTFFWSLSNDVQIIEVNEPFMDGPAAQTLVAILGNRIRSLLTRRRRAHVVTYAIGNHDPVVRARSFPLKARVRWMLRWPLSLLVWRLIDRVAFGTSIAADTYLARLGERGAPSERRVIPALPQGQLEVPEEVARPPVLVFVGDLAPRKGFDRLVQAWPAVREAVPDSHLVIVGTGQLENVARSLAEGDPRVSVHVAPPRATVLELISRSKVLVLLSQRTGRWREQVGLPIVEGLSLGCLVVTTDETGVAEWLSEHGHWVATPATSQSVIETALVEALRSDRAPADVVKDLPPRDGRAEAEAWLMSGSFG